MQGARPHGSHPPPPLAVPLAAPASAQRGLRWGCSPSPEALPGRSLRSGGVGGPAPGPRAGSGSVPSRRAGPGGASRGSAHDAVLLRPRSRRGLRVPGGKERISQTAPSLPLPGPAAARANVILPSFYPARRFGQCLLRGWTRALRVVSLGIVLQSISSLTTLRNPQTPF